MGKKSSYKFDKERETVIQVLKKANEQNKHFVDFDKLSKKQFFNNLFAKDRLQFRTLTNWN